MRKSNRNVVVALAIIVGIGLALYWMSGDVLQWLRVTLHGR